MAVCDPEEEEVATERLLARLGLSATDVPHLVEALTHPSRSNEQAGSDMDNQRLEFLGDAVLQLCVSELLMGAFDSVDEGQLTVMRASLVNASALAVAAASFDVAPALRLGRGADAAGERKRTNVMADAVEALLGAVYLDCGLDEARRVCRCFIEHQLVKLVAQGGVQRDAKSRLQELLQARGLGTPRYRVVAEEGPAHARTFRVQVEIQFNQEVESEACRPVDEYDNLWSIETQGSGSSKKVAEQRAATAALALLSSKDATTALLR
jgi:ribonuclease III